ncbi:hypothetical protein ACI09V_002326 [Cronobacter dublinensis]
MNKIKLTKSHAQIFSKKLKKLAIIQIIEHDLDNLELKEPDSVYSINQKKEYLYQSYIIHLVASWQEFNKDLVRYCFATLIKGSDSPSINSIAQSRIDELLKQFNTPSAKNVDLLFDKAFGVKKTSKQWTLGTTDSQMALTVLDNILKIRHEIAHTGSASEELSYKKNFEYMEAIYEIAVATERHVLESLNIK